MLAKTEAIVLHSVKYGESSAILKCYTRAEGLRSFIAGGLHSKKGVLKPSFVQPLSQLQLVYYLKGRSELKRVKEVSIAKSYEEIFYDPVKSSIALFLAEFLGKVINEEEANEQLYQYLVTSLEELDLMQEGFGKFHLIFMYRLSRYLGFAPEVPGKEAHYFDLINGVYSHFEPPHRHHLTKVETQLWLALHFYGRGETKNFMINAPKRDVLLKALLEYYRLHIHDFGELRSLPVLKELLH